MSDNRARYALQDGYIHNWLVLGPWIASSRVLVAFSRTDHSDPVVRVEALEPASV